MLPLKEASHEEHVSVDQKEWKTIFSVMENARKEPYRKYMKRMISNYMHSLNYWIPLIY